jgi:hypothetical protein
MRQEWFNPMNGRRYQVDVFEDMLGDWVLIRRWSGACRSGNQKMTIAKDYAQALQQLKGIESKRRQRGYCRMK